MSFCSNFRILIFDPLNWLQNPLINYTGHSEMKGPRITLSKRKTVPATTYNSKVASSYIKKKKRKKMNRNRWNSSWQYILCNPSYQNTIISTCDRYRKWLSSFTVCSSNEVFEIWCGLCRQRTLQFRLVTFHMLHRHRGLPWWLSW